MRYFRLCLILCGLSSSVSSSGGLASAAYLGIDFYFVTVIGAPAESCLEAECIDGKGGTFAGKKVDGTLSRNEEINVRLNIDFPEHGECVFLHQ